MDFLAEARRRAFSFWLRTGRLPSWAKPTSPEVKFNPWHDPDDGRFTFRGTGRYFGGGGGGNSSAQMHERPSGRGRRGEPYGGFGGGGQGFTGGGASGSWTAPDNAREEGRQEQPRAHGRDEATRPARRQSAEGQGRSGSDNPRSWHRIQANGYEFRLDETGLFRDLRGTLTFTDAPRRSRGAQSRAGGRDRRTTDDGGHFIAPRFNGPTEAFNHFPQDLNLNRGRYRVLEDQWNREGRSGKRVDVRIQAVYPKGSRRPSHLNVWFWIDGERQSLIFPNEPMGSQRDKR